jgi:hypothetical protein
LAQYIYDLWFIAFEGENWTLMLKGSDLKISTGARLFVFDPCGWLPEPLLPDHFLPGRLLNGLRLLLPDLFPMLLFIEAVTIFPMTRHRAAPDAIAVSALHRVT